MKKETSIILTIKLISNEDNHPEDLAQSGISAVDKKTATKNIKRVFLDFRLSIRMPPSIFPMDMPKSTVPITAVQVYTELPRSGAKILLAVNSTTIKEKPERNAIKRYIYMYRMIPRKTYLRKMR